MKSLSVSYSKRLSPSGVLLVCLILIFTIISCSDAYPTNPNVEPGDINQDEGNGEFNNFRQNHSKIEIYAMYSIIIIILQLGTLSTLYVILRTFVRWRRIEFSLNMTHKLPFYMSLSGKYF